MEYYDEDEQRIFLGRNFLIYLFGLGLIVFVGYLIKMFATLYLFIF